MAWLLHRRTRKAGAQHRHAGRELAASQAQPDRSDRLEGASHATSASLAHTDKTPQTTEAGALPPSTTVQDAIEQHEVIEALLRCTHVQLQGFLPSTANEDAQDLPSALARPLIEHAGQTRADMHRAVCEVTRRRRARAAAMRALAAIVMVAGVASAAFWAGSLHTAASNEGMAAPWRVIRVLDNGVVVQIGTGQASTQIEVPRGGLLPDGTKLSAVNAEKQIYSTPEQDVRVRTPKQP